MKRLGVILSFAFIMGTANAFAVTFSDPTGDIIASSGTSVVTTANFYSQCSFVDIKDVSLNITDTSIDVAITMQNIPTQLPYNQTEVYDQSSTEYNYQLYFDVNQDGNYQDNVSFSLLSSAKLETGNTLQQNGTLHDFLRPVYWSNGKGLSSKNFPILGLNEIKFASNGNIISFSIPNKVVLSDSTQVSYDLITSATPFWLHAFYLASSVYNNTTKKWEMNTCNDSFYSNPITPNKFPTASQVQVTGNAQVGQTLTGSYVYSDADSDPEGVSTFQWYRADDATGTNKVAISGAVAKTYVLTETDVGKFIGFAVKPIATKGTLSGIHAISTFIGAVTALNVLPVIESVTPLQSQWGKNTVFTVRGKNLTKGMGFTVGDCEHSNYELPGGTSTKRQFVCTQYGETGIKRGLVKTKRGGQELFTFNVQSDVVIRPRLYINSNTNQLSKNNTALEMYVSADLEGTSNLSTLYDLYLVIALPTGQFVYQSFQEGLSFEPKPFLANMAIPVLDDWFQVLSYNFSEALPKGNYRFHFFAINSGESISNVKSSSQLVASNSVIVNYDPNEILPTSVVRRSLEETQNFSPRRYASGNDVIGLASKLVRKYGLFNRERDVNRNKDSLMEAFNYFTDDLAYNDSLDDRQKDLFFAAKVLEMLYNNRSPWKTKNLANGVKDVFEAYNNHYSELANYSEFTVTLAFDHGYDYWEFTRDISVTVTPLIYYDFANSYSSNPTLNDVAIYPYDPKGASFDSIISFDIKSTGEKSFNVPMKGLYLIEITDNSYGGYYSKTAFLRRAGETKYISVDY